MGFPDGLSIAEIETNILIGLLIAEEGIWSLDFVFSSLANWGFCRKVAKKGGWVWPSDPVVGHGSLLASWDALRCCGMLLAREGCSVVGLPVNGVLVVNLLFFGVLILFCQNER